MRAVWRDHMVMCGMGCGGKDKQFKDTVEAKLANGLLNEIKMVISVAVSLLKVHY